MSGSGSVRSPGPLAKRFYTKPELADFLHISVYTIDSWVSERREIPFVKMGRRVMFDIHDIERWIERNKVQPDVE